MDEYREKFQKLGIESQEHDIVHPALTTGKYLKSVGMQDAVYCIGTEVFKNYLRSDGFTVIDGVSTRRSGADGVLFQNILVVPKVVSATPEKILG